VIEQTEGSRLLGITMREKILSRLLDLGEPQAELYTLFHEIDSSRNGSLSREEFAAFLNAIEINFSRKKWHQIFREIDLNYDDKISFEEFFLFLFPDHDVGLALEKRRMKLLGSRVKIKADRYEKEAQARKKTNAVVPAMLGLHSNAQVLPEAIDEEDRRVDSPSRVNPNYREKRTSVSATASNSHHVGGAEHSRKNSLGSENGVPNPYISPRASHDLTNIQNNNANNNNNNNNNYNNRPTTASALHIQISSANSSKFPYQSTGNNTGNNSTTNSHANMEPLVSALGLVGGNPLSVQTEEDAIHPIHESSEV